MLQMQGMVARDRTRHRRCRRAAPPGLVNAVLERDARRATPSWCRVAVFDATERREYERELLRAKHEPRNPRRRPGCWPAPCSRLIPPAFRRSRSRPRRRTDLPASGEQSAATSTTSSRSGRHWIVVIGDVCGKGVEAAVVTALARYTIRAAAARDSASPPRSSEPSTTPCCDTAATASAQSSRHEYASLDRVEQRRCPRPATRFR